MSKTGKRISPSIDMFGKKSMGKLIYNSYDDVSEFILSNILLDRNNNNLTTISRPVKFACSPTKFMEAIERLFGDNERFNIIGRHDCHLVTPITQESSSTQNDWFTIKSYSNSNISSATILAGTPDKIEGILNLLRGTLEEIKTTIEWVYNANGHTLTVPLQTEMSPVDEMYPWIKDRWGTLNNFYEEYMNNSASILLLYGPPGTGKTTFIKGLLNYAKCSAMVSYDAEILKRDSIFADFIEGETTIFVMEDSDKFLDSRESGNITMQKFLNIGDGLVTMKGKKLVFSTNLSSTDSIDNALLRPGRCFASLKFDTLTFTEACALAKIMGIPEPNNIDQKSRTIAEVFHPDYDSTGSDNLTSRRSSSVGFI